MRKHHVSINISLKWGVIQKVRDSWKSFFGWVKSVVPYFPTQRIVTDGALYIDKGFREAVGDKTPLIVCGILSEKYVNPS